MLLSFKQFLFYNNFLIFKALFSEMEKSRVFTLFVHLLQKAVDN